MVAFEDEKLLEEPCDEGPGSKAFVFSRRTQELSPDVKIVCA